ncbi:hypothetical protein [Bartonella acomydis]|uniref:Uncharacterized protein n=1 Tax=Bartonella acomydis TaxID=686234 RepID=A0ABP9MW74_9HYPH
MGGMCWLTVKVGYLSVCLGIGKAMERVVFLAGGLEHLSLWKVLIVSKLHQKTAQIECKDKN